MHTAVTDLNPNFSSGLLIAFLGDEDASRNGYDLARGPCCDKKKWAVAGDSQAFIPIEALSSDYFDIFVDVGYEDPRRRDYIQFYDGLDDELFGTIDETCEACGPEWPMYFDKYAVMAHRCEELTWGMIAVKETAADPKRFSHTAKMRRDSHLTDDDVEEFSLYGDCFDDHVDCCMKEEFLPTQVGNHAPVVAHYNWRCRLNTDPKRGKSHGKWYKRREKPWLARRETIRHMEIDLHLPKPDPEELLRSFNPLWGGHPSNLNNEEYVYLLRAA